MGYILPLLSGAKFLLLRSNEFLHRRDDGFRELCGLGFAADVARSDPAFLEDLKHGTLYLIGRLALSEVSEHEDGGLKQRRGVGYALSGYVRGGAVYGLKD